MVDPRAAIDRLTGEQRAMIARIREPLRALAHEVAAQFQTVDTDELAQVASEAVCRVAPGYDASRGATFLTYAYRRALGEMVDHATRETQARAVAVALHRGASRVSDLLEAGDPFEEDLPTSRRRLVDLTRSVAMAAAIGLMSTPALSPEAAYAAQEQLARTKSALESALADLGEMERTLVWQTIVEDVPLAEVARKVGLPYDRARYLVLKSLTAMDRSLRARGITPNARSDDPDVTHFR